MLRLLLALLALGKAAATAKVKHVVFLVMENRPYDFFYGFTNLPGANGLDGSECNTAGNASECVGNGTANYVCKDSASMSFETFTQDIWYNSSWDGLAPFPPEPAQWGAGYLATNEGKAEVMHQMSPAQVPIKTVLAREFAVFDRWHSSFPGPSTPNHLFLHTATANGCTTTGATFKCEKGATFPQKTIYENLAESNKTWAYYYNDTSWVNFIEFFNTADGQAGLETYDSFYHNAAAGTLPSFSWISPRQGSNSTTGDGPNDDHPCHDIALGERLLKDTYEALRAGPGWNETVFLVTYDDTGGWYDHAEVPYGVPAPDDNLDSCPDKTDYTWLGARVPALLISPLVPKGTVITRPNGPTPTSEYEHSSISATLKEIFELPNFLTRRDAWAGSFASELAEKKPRTDAPMHLPEAPAPAGQARAAAARGTGRRLDADELPRHCSALGTPHKCGHPTRAHKKQKQRMQQWAELNEVSAPHPESVTQAEADAFIAAQFHAHRERVLAGGAGEL